MSIVENKYHSTIKVEFRDLVDNIVNSNRKHFHMYTIHRLLSLGLLIDLPFRYVKTEDPNAVAIELDLKEVGKARFIVDTDSNYGIIADGDSKQILVNFLQHFDTKCDTKSKRRKFFNK